MRKTINFYTKILGFKLAERYAEWAELQGPELRIGIFEGRSKPSERFSIGFEVKNLDGVVKVLEKKGLKFERVTEDYGCFAYFKDPDGNELHFWQESE